MLGVAHHLAGGNLTTPPQATTPLHRSGLRPTRVAAWPIRCPAFRPWGASLASPAPGLLCPLLTSAGRSGRIAPPSVLHQDTPQISRGQLSYRPCIDAGFIKHSPSCGWRTLWSRAHSSRAYHTSYPVRVPRPAPSFHASFRPHLAVTPWRFPCPSAPRTPGQGTFTPKHDSMHGTHAMVRQRVETALRSSPHPPWQRPHHALTNGRSTPISTLAPSITACAIASGTNRRSRRYKSVWKTDWRRHQQAKSP